MTILCIDPSSTKVGWAIIQEDGHIESGRIVARGESFERCPNLIATITNMLVEKQVTEVFIENTSQYGGTHTTQETMELLAYVKKGIQFACQKREIPFWPVASATIKKEVCEEAGLFVKGIKKKEHTLQALAKLTPIQFIDDNVADVYALAITVKRIGNQLRKTTKEKRVEKGLKRCKKTKKAVSCSAQKSLFTNVTSKS